MKRPPTQSGAAGSLVERDQVPVQRLALTTAVSPQPHATGVLFIITQQVQPEFISVLRQSQHDWIISQHFWSPLVQVSVQPLSVSSHLHSPIVKQQVQTVMPFMTIEQEHMPPASMVQRFCIMLHAIGSSHVQVIFMPPVHFSILIVQRGTMT